MKSKDTWVSQLTLDEGSVSDLKWWLGALKAWKGKIILPAPVQGQMTTDASHIGWGGHMGSHCAQGFWDSEMSQKHSNIRELTAILLTLRAFQNFVKNKTIQILSDNVTSVTYLNHMGGPSVELTEIAKAIWQEALTNNTILVAKHLSGCLNTQADELSRLTDKYEWTLAEPMFHYLDRLWGPHTVDRFASALTTRLPKYNTRFLDPNGMPTDALAQTDWHHETGPELENPGPGASLPSGPPSTSLRSLSQNLKFST